MTQKHRLPEGKGYSHSGKPYSLGKRELEILHLAATGLTDKEIAPRLAIQIATVRTYWQRIRKKLDVVNRSHAIALAMAGIASRQASDHLARAALRAIYDEVIAICDHDGVLLTWNRGAELLFGFTETEWVGQNHAVLYPADDAGEAERELLAAARSRASTQDRWFQAKDKSLFYATSIMIDLEYGEGEAVFVKIVRPKPAP